MTRSRVLAFESRNIIYCSRRVLDRNGNRLLKLYLEEIIVTERGILFFCAK